MSQTYEILTGVGTLYYGAVGATFPLLEATPSASWTSLGHTTGGVKVTADQKTAEITPDQHSGPIMAFRTGESLMVETKLLDANLENVALLLGGTVADTPASSGVIGKRALTLHRGLGQVAEHALLFRGATQSPYYAGPAQFKLPRGYLDGPVTLEYKKDGSVELTLQFKALEDLTGTEADSFGTLEVQDAAAT
jgi:hypothetical protein